MNVNWKQIVFHLSLKQRVLIMWPRFQGIFSSNDRILLRTGDCNNFMTGFSKNNINIYNVKVYCSTMSPVLNILSSLIWGQHMRWYVKYY